MKNPKKNSGPCPMRGHTLNLQVAESNRIRFSDVRSDRGCGLKIRKGFDGYINFATCGSRS